MSRLTIYEKPTCSTCQRAVALLREAGVEFARVDYFSERFNETQLRRILAKAGLRPRDLVRLKEEGARQLALDDDDATLRALVERPELLQRPIVERGERALLGRPPEKILELLG